MMGKARRLGGFYLLIASHLDFLDFSFMETKPRWSSRLYGLTQPNKANVGVNPTCDSTAVRRAARCVNQEQPYIAEAGRLREWYPRRHGNLFLQPPIRPML